MSREFAFAITIGNRELSEMSDCLVKSIRRSYPEAPILAYVTDTELPELDRDTIEFFRRHTTVRTGGFPRPEYPISAKLEAMTLAADAFEFDYLAFLDSDTVLLDTFDAFLAGSPKSDIYAKPVDISGKWDTETQWEPIAAETGYELPKRRIVSTVDRRRIIPFYNAGVVITTSQAFPSDWLDLTMRVYDAIENGNSVFADQIALGLLSQRYDLTELTELENYPLHLYPTLSRDAILAHYHSYAALTKVHDQEAIDILIETGLYEKIPARAWAVSRIYEPTYREQHSRANELAGILKREDVPTILRGAGNAVSQITSRL
jgi:hypothetical protein